MLEMNPGIRARWTAALRSGKYPQGKERLNRNGKFCCLGVLCELAAAAGVTVRETDGVTVRETGDSEVRYDNAYSLLPESVEEWAGLDDGDNGNAWIDHPDFGRIDLAGLNDDGMPFAEIADLIDGGAA